MDMDDELLDASEWLGELVDYLGVDDAAEWLRDPCPELKHRSPLQAISDGDQEQVIGLVTEMIST